MCEKCYRLTQPDDVYHISIWKVLYKPYQQYLVYLPPKCINFKLIVMFPTSTFQTIKSEVLTSWFVYLVNFSFKKVKLKHSSEVHFTMERQYSVDTIPTYNTYCCTNSQLDQVGFRVSHNYHQCCQLNSKCRCIFLLQMLTLTPM